MSPLEVAKLKNNGDWVLHSGKHRGKTFAETLAADQRYCTWVRNLETPRHCLKYFHEYLNAVWQEQMDELDRDIHENEEEDAM